MAKVLSEKEAKLQKKLVPLNIFVCIISLIAAVSLLFMPVLKVDFGKILNSTETMQFVEDKINESIDDTMEGVGPKGVDYKPAAASIVKKVLSSVEGDLSVNAFGAAKVAFASSEEKPEKVLNELLFGDEALITQLINSISESVAALFTEEEGQALLEDMIVATITTGLIEDLNVEKATAENIRAISEKFKAIESGNIGSAVDGIVAEINEIFGDEVNVSAEEKAALTAEAQKLYDNTATALKGQPVTMEAIVCVTLSENVDLSQIQINKIFDELLGAFGETPETPEGSAARLKVVEGEAEGEDGDPSQEQPDENPEQSSGTPVEPPATAPDGERVIVTNYDGLLKQMHFDEDEIRGSLHGKLQNAFNALLDRNIGEKTVNDYVGYYAYVFYGCLAFIVPWVILFLFSFIHLLKKNKRFMMWYVKLYSFLPALVFFVAPLLAPKLLPILVPDIMQGEWGALILRILSGVTSFTVISGICYVLLWLTSIFWAFPIKRKIRKERKACKEAQKNGTYSYYNDFGEEPKGKKGKKGKDAPAAPYSQYTYGDYGSNEDFYANPYADPYGSSHDPYTPSLGGYDSYDTGGFDDPYEDGYYGSDLGGYDDYDSYGSYGSSIFDDDDDIY